VNRSAKRTVTIVQLPRHCSRHKFCAYTGLEQDRCPICHATYIQGICPHMTLPPGRKRPCFCDSCGELFTSISSFDKHQSPSGICRDPLKRGLILVEQGGWELWSLPGSRPFDAVGDRL